MADCAFRKGIVVLVAGCCLLGAATTPTAVGAEPSATAASYRPDAEECKFLNLVNNYRKKHHAPALQLSATLGAAADFHSTEMARKNYFSHNLKGLGIAWDQNIKRFGYTGPYIGENIAAGGAKANQAFKQWKRSAPHRRNMLYAKYHAIGIGRAFDKGAKYDWYWTTDFGGQPDQSITC